jgi:ketosteroid isomerase-like protein
MKLSRWLIVLLLLGTCAHAQSPVDAESKVRALECLWGEAAQLRDIKALQSIFDDSLVYAHIDGRLMTKAEVLADTKAVSSVNIVVESSMARAYGDAVIVEGVLLLRGIERGKPYSRHGRFVDTWLYKDGHWLCVSSMTTPMGEKDNSK